MFSIECFSKLYCLVIPEMICKVINVEFNLSLITMLEFLDKVRTRKVLTLEEKIEKNRSYNRRREYRRHMSESKKLLVKDKDRI